MAFPEDSSQEQMTVESGDTKTRQLSVLRLANGKQPPGLEKRAIPSRYRIKKGGSEGRYVSCRDAPSLRLVIERGVTASASAARNAPPGTIFLDGAAKGPPFLDTERGVYNLDHHEGCVRSFTLSTCEQAFVLVAKGLDLQAREWKVRANEPDLDVVLAAWVLLNHRRLRDDERLRRRILPLLRLEGAIDVHGFDLRELAALPQDLDRRTYQQLEAIGQPEIDAKREGRWSEIDFLSYTADRLRFIDGLVFDPEDFSDRTEIEELSRAELPDRKLAVACRAEVGIYRVEEELRRLYGDRLGMIILQKGPRAYTLRQVDSFLGGDLHRAYERLNLADRAAGNSRSSHRWGGSEEIGGSPRTSGTALGVGAITRICADAFRRPSLGQRLAAITGAALAAVATSLVAWLSFAVFPPTPMGDDRAVWVSVALLTIGMLALVVGVWRGPGYLGLRRPVGLLWIGLLPLALLAAVAGGAWTLSPTGPGPPSLPTLGSALLLALVAETLHRGAIYGLLLRVFRPASPTSWRPTTQLVASSLLYAGSMLVPGLPLLRRPWTSPADGLALFGAALALGLACGYARERSESLLPPLLLHVSAVAAALLLGVG